MQMGQEVFDVKNASHVVAIILIDRYARIVVLDNTLQHITERSLEIKINHILATGHDFLSRLVAKTDNTLQHTLFILDILLIREFERLFEIIDTQNVILLLYHLACQDARLHQNGLEGPEQTTEETDVTYHRATEAQRLLTSVYLWHNLAKEQDKESENDGNAQEFNPIGTTEIDNLRKEIVAEHDDGDIDQIVGNQYGGQCALGISPKLQYLTVTFSALFLQLAQIGWRE